MILAMHYTVALFRKRFFGVEEAAGQRRRQSGQSNRLAPFKMVSLANSSMSLVCATKHNQIDMQPVLSSTPDSSYATEPNSSAATRWVTDGVTPLIGRPLIFSEGPSDGRQRARPDAPTSCRLLLDL